ncbi:ATP-binding cassette domain-containing protein [Planctobacterium marinum]
MILLKQFALMQGGEYLIKDASLQFNSGQRIGIIGRNGCGKSTFFKAVLQQFPIEEGELSVPPEWQVAHVAQETPAVEKPALQYVLDGEKQLRHLQAQLETANEANDGILIAELHGKLQDIGADTIEARAGIILSGLGFEQNQHHLPVSSFSGGWRMRLNLAQALLKRSDLLLLDEPTNHLDLDAVIWLESWLRGYEGCLMLISHDRDFLDAVVNHIVSFEQTNLRAYTGNYSSFEKQRAERLRLQEATARKQQEKAAHLQKFIDRFGAKASKAKQAQSRKKQLDKLVQIIPETQDSSFSFSFFTPEKLPNPLVLMEKTEAGYGDVSILRNIQLNLVPGSRIGLLGRNGAGKSTLIKMLAGDLAPLSGEYARSAGLKVGYFSQHQMDKLHPDMSALQHFQVLDPKATEQSLRNFIGSFGFHGDDALSPVAPMSGGEKARLSLALIVYEKPNLLLLDEPTNHLDMQTRLGLTLALQSFEGAMVIVSHDRFLISAVSDEYYLVDNAQVGRFDGDIHDYEKWVLTKPVATSDKQQESSSGKSRKDIKRLEAQFRQEIQPIKKRLNKGEKQMEQCQQQLDELQVSLADTSLYEEQNKSRLKDLLAKQTQLTSELQEAEEIWFEAQEALESAENEFRQSIES